LTPLASLRCQSNGTLYLPTGFRVDVDSCTVNGNANRTRRSVAALENATNRVATQIFPCMQDINPGMFKWLQLKMSTLGPTVRCTHQAHAQKRLMGLACQPTEATCIKETQADFSATPENARSTGFHMDNSPGNIFLTKSDPTVNDAFLNSPGTEVPAATTGATPLARMTARRTSYTHDNVKLSSVIFHELLHAGHIHSADGDRHTLEDPTDDVFACQSACGSPGLTGLTGVTMRDLCVRCASAVPEGMSATAFESAYYPNRATRMAEIRLLCTQAFP
jgi:hypothetical protein